MSKVEAKSKNLNKLSDTELAAHKRGMDKQFEQNQLKPGDAGFVYDKVVEFNMGNGEGLEDDSWGEDDGVQEDQFYGEEDEDDELEKQVNALVQQQAKNRDSNCTDDYFEDDFEDDFA